MSFQGHFKQRSVFFLYQNSLNEINEVFNKKRIQLFQVSLKSKLINALKVLLMNMTLKIGKIQYYFNLLNYLKNE